MIKLKILIVDDEIDYCLIMKSYFQEKGYDVHLAYSIEEGLAALEDVKPDILFLDNNLPDGRGWQYVDRIVEKIPQLKIYLISAYRQRSDFSSESSNITIWEKPISLTTLDAVF